MGFWCHRFSFQQAIVCHWKQPTHTHSHTPVRVQPNIEYITSPIRSMDWIHIETIDSHFRFLSRLRAYCSLSVAVYPVLTLTRAGAPFELADLLNKHKDLRCFRCVLSLPSLGHALCVRLCVCVCVCGTLSFPHSNHFFFLLLSPSSLRSVDIYYLLCLSAVSCFVVSYARSSSSIQRLVAFLVHYLN